MGKKLPKLLLAIFIGCAIVILILLLKLTLLSSRVDWNNNIQPYTKDFFIEGNDRIINGRNDIDENRKFFILYTSIDSIRLEKDKVIARTSTIMYNRVATYDIALYDKKVFNSFFLISSHDQHYPTGAKTDVREFRNSADTYKGAKILEGKLVQFFIRLEPLPNDKAVLTCNKKFASFIRGDIKNLNCVPFSSQAYFYEN